MTTAILCCALLGMLVLGLGMLVSAERRRSKRAIGMDEDPSASLYKRVRAHGNASEYAPIFAVLILLLGVREPAAWMQWVMGIVTASRYLHAAGMLLSPTLSVPHPLRALGAAGTYLGGIALCVAVLASL